VKTPINRVNPPNNHVECLGSPSRLCAFAVDFPAFS